MLFRLALPRSKDSRLFLEGKNTATGTVSVPTAGKRRRFSDEGIDNFVLLPAQSERREENTNRF
jgi:hypothetical protein